LFRLSALKIVVYTLQLLLQPALRNKVVGSVILERSTKDGRPRQCVISAVIMPAGFQVVHTMGYRPKQGINKLVQAPQLLAA
jgi:hypothetical protein